MDQFFNFIPEKETEDEILTGSEKWFGGDDWWRWISSRTIGMKTKEKNDIISRILMASRKALVTVSYSTQLWSMIEKNIREITDLLMKPILSPDHTYCKVFVYGVVEGKLLQPLQPFYFNTEPIFASFNTYERAGDIIMNQEENPEKELIEENKPISDNPAWKKYCRDVLGIPVNSELFLKKCNETMEGLKRGL